MHKQNSSTSRRAPLQVAGIRNRHAPIACIHIQPWRVGFQLGSPNLDVLLMRTVGRDCTDIAPQTCACPTAAAAPFAEATVALAHASSCACRCAACAAARAGGRPQHPRQCEDVAPCRAQVPRIAKGAERAIGAGRYHVCPHERRELFAAAVARIPASLLEPLGTRSASTNPGSVGRSGCHPFARSGCRTRHGLHPRSVATIAAVVSLQCVQPWMSPSEQHMRKTNNRSRW